jgi:hypothetical protein
LSLAIDVDLGHDGVSGRAGHQGQSCSGVLHDCCLMYCCWLIEMGVID